MIVVSVGRANGPKRRDRWVVRFQGSEIRRQEFYVTGRLAAEAKALDWAAYFEQEGCKVEISLPTPGERGH